MRTGIHQGPRGLRDISAINEPLNLDMSLAESVRLSISKATWLSEVSISKATWLSEEDLGAAKQAVLLAETIDAFPEKRHQNAPILIALLGNLGLLNNRKATEMSPADMLAAIANG